MSRSSYGSGARVTPESLLSWSAAVSPPMLANCDMIVLASTRILEN
jgi:hypothetical protein